jgi:hypothetical protein
MGRGGGASTGGGGHERGRTGRGGVSPARPCWGGRGTGEEGSGEEGSGEERLARAKRSTSGEGPGEGGARRVHYAPGSH